MTKLSNSNFEASISGCFLKRAIHKMKLYCEVIEHQDQMWIMQPEDLATATDKLEFIKEELVEKKRENSLLKTLLENYRNHNKPVGGQTKKEVLSKATA